MALVCDSCGGELSAGQLVRVDVADGALTFDVTEAPANDFAPLH